MSTDRPFKSLEDLHNEYPWKTFKKFAPLAHKYGFKDDKAIQNLLNNVSHDLKVSIDKTSYLPIFSTMRDAYQFDTVFIKKRGYLVFININTRKAFIYELENKGTNAVLKAMKTFIEEAKPKYLQSDQDSAYLANNTLEFIHNHKIAYETVSDNDHHILGIINRFVRTIRDMHPTSEQLHKFVKTYNETPHSALGDKSPDEITPEIEDKYIEQKQAETEEKLSKRHKFNVGDRVRVIIENTNKLDKKRTNVSTQSYEIDSIAGNQYLIRAKDGSIDKVPYFRLIPMKDNDKTPLANTIKNNKRGVIVEIVKFIKPNKYMVKYESYDRKSNNETDIILAKNLREGTPTILSPMEKQFWSGKTDIPNEIRKWIYTKPT
jgi:hypothetical protein